MRIMIEMYQRPAGLVNLTVHQFRWWRSIEQSPRSLLGRSVIGLGQPIISQSVRPTTSKPCIKLTYLSACIPSISEYFLSLLCYRIRARHWRRPRPPYSSLLPELNKNSPDDDVNHSWPWWLFLFFVPEIDGVKKSMGQSLLFLFLNENCRNQDGYDVAISYHQDVHLSPASFLPLTFTSLYSGSLPQHAHKPWDNVEVSSPIKAYNLINFSVLSKCMISQGWLNFPFPCVTKTYQNTCPPPTPGRLKMLILDESVN